MTGLLEIFDPKAPPKAIGIDLGTTNSLVAYVKNDRPTTVLDCDQVALLTHAQRREAVHHRR